MRLTTQKEIDNFCGKVVADCACDCLVWVGSRTDGYGKLNLRGKTVRAHRVAYETWRAPIGYRKVIDHLCRNPACVNPAHMEPVTDRENILRGEGRAAKQARVTRCVNGHEYTPENTALSRAKSGHLRKNCRECHRERTRKRAPAYNAKRRARLRAPVGAL